LAETQDGTETLTHLDKAKGALAAARDIIETAQPDYNGRLPVKDSDEFQRKLSVAAAQAHVASAEALTRIADMLEGRFA
jgi:hypothetical protein